MLRADHPLAGQDNIALDQLDPAEATLMAESHADGLHCEGSEHGHVQDVSLESLAALVSLRGGYALVPALAHERLASMPRSEEHTSELQSLMRISYAVFCLKKKKMKEHDVTYYTWTQRPPEH